MMRNIKQTFIEHDDDDEFYL